MYPKFLVKYQKFAHFKNFLTFQIAAVYFKNFKNPETPKYVVKPRNIAYQSRWKVWKIDWDNQKYKSFNGTGFFADYVKM